MELKTYQKNELNTSKIVVEITESNCIDGFEGVKYANNVLTIFGNAIIDEAQLDLLVSSHQVVDLLNEEIEKYNQRIYDGKVAIITLMSELRLNAIQNNHPREINRAIENAFWDVAISINNGWWITAKEKCELVMVSGYVTQELWDRIYNRINDYIAVNY